MKKTFFILAAFVTLITACGSNSSNSPAPDKSMTPLSDSAKIDTVKATDSIIKG